MNRLKVTYAKMFSISLGLSTFVFCGCSSPLRSSFCTQPLATLPAQFQGVYDVVIPIQSAAWSSNFIIKTMQIEISAQSLMSSREYPGMGSLGQVCEVQGRYFAEQINQDGTYSVSELSKFTDGLVISGLTIDLDRARHSKMVLQYIPRDFSLMDDSTGSNSFGGQMSSTSFILDNRNLTPEQVLAVSTPFSLQFVLRQNTGLRHLKAVQQTMKLVAKP